ncbi:MAG: hypothetical protein L3J37_01720 [Rhodobacteraceae bacterium]|nr:hypothetical protein [Paracoccaceae bacterium]
MTCLNKRPRSHPVRHWLRAAVLSLFLGAPALAEPPELVLRLGMDSFTRDQSTISGLSGLSLFVVNKNNFYFGQSLYAAALGQGGGFFVGGIEVGKYIPINDRYFLDASLFVGGGGGASQVPGDGLMIRPQVQFGVDLGKARLGAGIAWTTVSGSAISTPSFGLSLSRPLDLALVNGPETEAGGTEFSQMRTGARIYYPQGSLKRGGVPLQPMKLIGAEMVFARQPASETFIVAHGAVAGDAEGYADWLMGQRLFMGEGALRIFAEASAGIGGGGAVDTGGGLIASAGIGARWQPGRFGVSLGVNAISSLNGDFLVISPAFQLGLAFGKGNSGTTRTNWQISSGLTQQFPNLDFRKPGVQNQGAPLMIDTKIDLFLNERIYMSGQAYTALAGGAGGYQIGLVGLGYRMGLGERLALSGEVFVGAGGGAGVDTRGGLLLAYGVDLDYRLNDTVYLTLGGGSVWALKGEGMAPMTANIGLKFPFTTLN